MSGKAMYLFDNGISGVAQKRNMEKFILLPNQNERAKQRQKMDERSKWHNKYTHNQPKQWTSLSM